MITAMMTSMSDRLSARRWGILVVAASVVVQASPLSAAAAERVVQVAQERASLGVRVLLDTDIDGLADAEVVASRSADGTSMDVAVRSLSRLLSTGDCQDLDGSNTFVQSGASTSIADGVETLAVTFPTSAVTGGLAHFRWVGFGQSPPPASSNGPWDYLPDAANPDPTVANPGSRRCNSSASGLRARMSAGIEVPVDATFPRTSSDPVDTPTGAEGKTDLRALVWDVGATSTTLTVSVEESRFGTGTTASLAVSSNPSVVTTGLTLTAQVTPGSGAATPTGAVVFLDGASVLGSATLSDGTAALTTNALSPGAHMLTARYDGDVDSAASTSPAIAQQVNYTDVPATGGFGPDIYWMTDRGIAGGFPDGSFRPTNAVTRQAFAAYLYRYDHNGEDAGPCATGTSSFPDVPDTSPFCSDIAWLASTGITSGFPDGTFRPGTAVTRQSAAAFLYRYNHAGVDAGPCPAGTSAFSDVPDSSQFCGDIAWLATTSPQPITNGFPDGTFRPAIAVTRQAAAAYFHRYDTNFGA